MARSKEYDRQEVLDNATRIFWGRGYEATPISMIVDETRLNTASLYKEFGNKEGLFEAALENYEAKQLEPFIAVLIEEPGLKGLKGFLRNIREGAEIPDFKGCLFMNVLAEKDAISDAAVKRVEKFCVRLETLLESSIRSAQRNGEIAPEKDPRSLASFIACILHGIVLYARTEDNKKRVESVLRTLEEAISG